MSRECINVFDEMYKAKNYTWSDLVKKGKVISVPGLQYRLWPLVTRVAPRSLVTRIMRAQHERT